RSTRVRIREAALRLDELRELQEAARNKGRAVLLHQLPGDIVTIQRKWNGLRQCIQDAQDVRLIDDSLQVTIMFTKAAIDKELWQLPLECAKMLDGEWSEQLLAAFAKRVVCDAARTKACCVFNSKRADPKISKSELDQ